MAPVHHHTSTCFYEKSPTAAPPSLTGCSPTACNSTVTRRSSCGAQRTIVNIACPLFVLLSALFVRLQPLRFVALASTLTRICQGSVLGPLLFAMYISPMASVVAAHGLCYHQYADDTQLYMSIQPQSTTEPCHCASTTSVSGSLRTVYC